MHALFFIFKGTLSSNIVLGDMDFWEFGIVINQTSTCAKPSQGAGKV
jgi:hypothetical protein